MGSLSENSNTLSSQEALKSALQQAHQEYSDVHPKSRKSYENACKYMPGGNTRTVLYTTPFPFIIASAYGCTLKTVDGLEYTDFLGEYTAGIYGHNNPNIRKVRDIEELLSLRLQATRVLSTSPDRTPQEPYACLTLAAADHHFCGI
jgi:4-aminobutyrate aminotransferase-like enzyme